MDKNLLTLKNYAHIGDAIWEVFVREFIIFKTSNSKLMHKLTTDRVNAHFQKSMLDNITPFLSEQELELVRRARNPSITNARKSIQVDYRLATAFEVLIGFWYINDKNRLNEIYNIISQLEPFK